MVYFKRFYKDGSVRPARLRVNDFVARHLSRQDGDACVDRTNRCTGDRPIMELGSDEERNETWPI